MKPEYMRILFDEECAKLQAAEDLKERKFQIAIEALEKLARYGDFPFVHQLPDEVFLARETLEKIKEISK